MNLAKNVMGRAAGAALVAALLAGSGALAGEVGGLTEFSPNTPARAAEVNGNFTAVKTAVDDNDQRLDALEPTVTDHGDRLDTIETTELAALRAAINALLPCPPDAPERFTDNGDGTVCDRDTGLMWEVKLAADDPACLDADQANRDLRCVQNQYLWTDPNGGTEPSGTLFTEFLARMNTGANVATDADTISRAGYTDWRIPTVVELQSIQVSNCASVPCIDPVFGPTLDRLYSTSSALPPPFSGTTWRVSFGILGGTAGGGKKASEVVRAVRGGR